ncbi:MAG: HAMP domain-containing protein [Chromatiales bacterium]|nr:HAMP domain-containing protein [Chromatiales bacterium]
MRIGKLELKMMNYFLLIAIAAILIGFEFYLQLSDIDYLKTLYAEYVASGNEQTINDFPPAIADLRDKIVIMFVMLSGVAAIVMLMFIKNITLPLGKMILISQAINQGDLSHYIEIEQKDEIGELGQAINELTSNFQELASLTMATCEELEKSLHRATEKMESDVLTTKDELESMHREIAMLQQFLNEITLLGAEK